MLYIYAPGNTPVSYPQRLPKSWMSPEGVSILGFDGLSNAELARWGWFPVNVEPLIANQKHGALIREQGEWVLPAEFMTDDEIYERDLAACYEARKAAYGTWQEQLDMQFKGTWELHVAAVKAAHPKPTR